jgi:hypothetical protein
MARGMFSRLLERRGGNEWVYLAIGVLAGIVASQILTLISRDVSEFLYNLAPEAVGILFTVIVIDRLDANREDRLIRERLLRETHSRYNPVALQAIEELRVMGYLEDGTLSGRSLRGASWQDANLYRADLRNTDLINAELGNADFYEANLEGAKVTPEQLRTAKTMRRCTMPDGSKYDGRYNLSWDLALMKRDGFDANDPASAAAYYEVPLEAYLAGQAAEGRALSRG